MPTFIKAGFWEQKCEPCNGYKGWLNLDSLIRSVAGTSGTTGSSGSSGTSGTSGTSGLTGEAGDRYQTTSSTSFTLGTGGTITIGTGLAYTVAQDILIAYNISNHQVSMVISYNPATGVLVFDTPSAVVGSGTYNSWGVNLNGAAGGNGTNGTSGTSGLTGSSGTSGSSGTRGTSGTSGSSGTTGTSGTSGVSPTLPTTISYGLYAQTADSTPVTNTTVETTIIGPGVGTLTVPANAFSIGNSFICALDGLISCTSSSTVQIRVKTVAGALLADTGIIDLAAATDKTWLINLYFTVRTLGAAGTASLSSGGLFSYIRNGGTQFEGYVLSNINNTTFDTTISNTLVISAQWDAATTSDSIFSRNFTLTKVY